MSRTYNIRVAREVREEVREEDQKVINLRINNIIMGIPVAPREKMIAWMKEALVDKGARLNNDGTLSMDMDEVSVTIDLENGQAVIRAESVEDVEINIDREMQVFDMDDNMEKARETAEEMIDKEFGRARHEAMEEAGRKASGRARDMVTAVAEEVQKRINEAGNLAIEKGLDENSDKVGNLISKAKTDDTGSRIVWEIETRESSS